MPLPFFLAAIFGKAAAGAVAKGIAAKAAAKVAVGHHGHHALAKHVAKKAAETSVHAAVEKRRKKGEPSD
jgi:hypothetical protein